MASLKGVEVRIPPLELKENSELECWRDFILRFEIALINTNLSTNEDVLSSDTAKSESSTSKSKEQMETMKQNLDFRRGGLLLNTIGSEGYRIFTKWNIPAKEISFNDLVARYEEKFTNRQNLFITRHRFLSMEQLSSEKVETFFDRVSKAATFCKFEGLEDDMTLQIITKGLRDDKLRKELLATDKLDIRKAQNICHLFVTAEESNDFLTDKTETLVAAVESKSTHQKSEWRKSKGECFICKSKDHWSKKCPDRKRRDTRPEVTSCRCGLKGHIARSCRSKGNKVREIKTDDSHQRYKQEPESDESF